MDNTTRYIPTSCEGTTCKQKDFNIASKSNNITRYVGMCGEEGNPVFTDTSVAAPRIPPSSSAYKPGEHPFYRTSGGDLGQQPSLGNIPIPFRPKDCSFTKSRANFANYQDHHFTTYTDKGFLSP